MAVNCKMSQRYKSGGRPQINVRVRREVFAAIHLEARTRGIPAVEVIRELIYPRYLGGTYVATSRTDTDTPRTSPLITPQTAPEYAGKGQAERPKTLQAIDTERSEGPKTGFND